MLSKIEAGNEGCCLVYLDARELCTRALKKLTYRKDHIPAVQAAKPFIELSIDLLLDAEKNIAQAPKKVIIDCISVAIMVSAAAVLFFKTVDEMTDTSPIDEDLGVINRAKHIDLDIKNVDLLELAQGTIAASQRVLNFVPNPPCLII